MKKKSMLRDILVLLVIALVFLGIVVVRKIDFSGTPKELKILDKTEKSYLSDLVEKTVTIPLNDGEYFSVSSFNKNGAVIEIRKNEKNENGQGPSKVIRFGVANQTDPSFREISVPSESDEVFIHYLVSEDEYVLREFIDDDSAPGSYALNYVYVKNGQRYVLNDESTVPISISPFFEYDGRLYFFYEFVEGNDSKLGIYTIEDNSLKKLKDIDTRDLVLPFNNHESETRLHGKHLIYVLKTEDGTNIKNQIVLYDIESGTDKIFDVEGDVNEVLYHEDTDIILYSVLGWNESNGRQYNKTYRFDPSKNESQHIEPIRNLANARIHNNKVIFFNSVEGDIAVYDLKKNTLKFEEFNTRVNRYLGFVVGDDSISFLQHFNESELRFITYTIRDWEENLYV